MIGDVAFVDLTTSTHEQIKDKHRADPISQWVGGSSALYLNDWQIAALKGIYKVGTLPPNWDSEGGKPLATHVVTYAQYVIRSLPFEDLAIPFVVPTPRGGIQFEWADGRRELDIEMLPDFSLEFLKVEDGQPAGEGSVHSSQLHGLFKWLRNEPE